jgi:hypothetical protein
MQLLAEYVIGESFVSSRDIDGTGGIVGAQKSGFLLNRGRSATCGY